MQRTRQPIKDGMGVGILGNSWNLSLLANSNHEHFEPLSMRAKERSSKLVCCEMSNPGTDSEVEAGDLPRRRLSVPGRIDVSSCLDVFVKVSAQSLHSTET